MGRAWERRQKMGRDSVLNLKIAARDKNRWRQDGPQIGGDEGGKVANIGAYSVGDENTIATVYQS